MEQKELKTFWEILTYKNWDCLEVMLLESDENAQLTVKVKRVPVFRVYRSDGLGELKGTSVYNEFALLGYLGTVLSRFIPKLMQEIEELDLDKKNAQRSEKIEQGLGEILYSDRYHELRIEREELEEFIFFLDELYDKYKNVA